MKQQKKNYFFLMRIQPKHKSLLRYKGSTTGTDFYLTKKIK